MAASATSGACSTRRSAAVVGAMRRLSGSLARLTWITSGYGWLAIVVPILAAAPGYFSGELTIGGLMMVVGAFNQVQAALRWFVDNFPEIADWRATLASGRALHEALDRARRGRRGRSSASRSSRIRAGGWLSTAQIALPRRHASWSADATPRSGPASAC